MNRLMKLAHHDAQSSHTKESAPDVISEHKIRECAYFIYKDRGGRYGTAQSDWLQAEEQLKADQTT